MKSDDYVHLVLDEVDEARETLELVRQLAELMPLRGIDSMQKALGGAGITFRGRPFDANAFAQLIPAFIFPIEEAAQLVELAYFVVKAAPPSVAYPEDDEQNARREVRRAALRRLASDGWLRPSDPRVHVPIGVSRPADFRQGDD